MMVPEGVLVGWNPPVLTHSWFSRQFFLEDCGGSVCRGHLSLKPFLLQGRQEAEAALQRAQEQLACQAASVRDLEQRLAAAAASPQHTMADLAGQIPSPGGSVFANTFDMWNLQSETSPSFLPSLLGAWSFQQCLVERW